MKVERRSVAELEIERVMFFFFLWVDFITAVCTSLAFCYVSLQEMKL